MSYLVRASKAMLSELDHSFTPRLSDYNQNYNETTADKIWDVAGCAIALVAGITTFLAFPQLTLAGFALGHIYRRPIRQVMNDFNKTFWKVFIVAKVTLFFTAFASLPYIAFAIPIIVGCYVGWQALDKTPSDNHFIKSLKRNEASPRTTPRQINFSGGTLQTN